MIQELTLGMYLAMGASTGYDLQTTRMAIGRGARESNPILRPFVNHRVAAYPVAFSLGVLSTEASLKLKKQKVWWWWAPWAVNVGGHTFFGWRNTKVRR